jgi:hypothetical protein
VNRICRNAIPALLVAVALTASGCASQAPMSGATQARPDVVATQTPHPEPSSTPTVAQAATPTVALTPKPSRPVVRGIGAKHTPKVDSPERVALMAAARARLKTRSKFEVVQLISDRAWAVAQLNPVSGGSGQYVAFRNQQTGGWVAFWSSPKASGAKKAILVADPRIPRSLVDDVDFSGRPSASEVVNAALRLGKNDSPSLHFTGGALGELTKDSRGRWWAVVNLTFTEGERQDNFFMYKDSGRWKLYTVGTGVGSSDMPNGVHFDSMPW